MGKPRDIYRKGGRSSKGSDSYKSQRGKKSEFQDGGNLPDVFDKIDLSDEGSQDEESGGT